MFGKFFSMEPIANRIYIFFYKHKGYKNDTLIAKDLGYSHPEKISRLFRPGTNAKPSVDIIEDITKKFGEELNLEWLITGHGQMLKPETSQLDIAVAPDRSKLELSATLSAEISSIRLSLEILERAAIEHLGLGKGAPSQEVLPLGKKTDQGKASKKSNKRTGNT